MVNHTKDLEAFKREYEALCLKHGFEISACGCCGSPWITDAEGGMLKDADDKPPAIEWPKETVQKASNAQFERSYGKEFKW